MSIMTEIKRGPVITTEPFIFTLVSSGNRMIFSRKIQVL